MKIVLDVNVLVAGLATRGLCSDIIEYCLRLPRQLVMSSPIGDDVELILIEKFDIPRKQASMLTKELLSLAHIVQPKDIDVPQLRDKDDAVIIATAIAAKSHYVVTGDKDLLILKKYDEILFLSPRQFHQSYLNEAL